MSCIILGTQLLITSGKDRTLHLSIMAPVNYYDLRLAKYQEKVCKMSQK